MAKQKPETEQKLEELQTIYLETRDTQIWKEMFDIMIRYARSLTLKVNKGKVFLEPDHVLGVATDAAIKVMERYNDPTFKIDHSFAGLLRWKVIESLYGGWEEDVHLSLNFIMQEDASSKVELGDLQEKLGATTLGANFTVELDEASFDDLVAVVKDILKEFDLACDNYRLTLLSRLYLLLLLRKSKIRHSLSIFKRYLNLTPKEEEVLDLLLLEVRNRLSLVS